MLKLSKLAQGLPVGGEIENLDDGTLFRHLKIEMVLATKQISFFF